MSGLRASLRIARREALRSKGRSALVVAMIGVPMLGLAFADVAVRTSQLPRAEVARRELGAADLVAELVSGSPVYQEDLHSYGVQGDQAKHSDPPGSDPDIAAVLPPGSRVAAWRTLYGVRLAAGERVLSAEVTHADLHDPVARGTYRLRRGTLPRAADEVALSPRASRDLGAGIGGTVRLGDAVLRVTAIVDSPMSPSSTSAYVPRAVTAPMRGGMAADYGRRWAVTLPPGASDVALVPALNRLGMRVLPRTWYLDPPPSPLAGYSGGPDVEAIGVTLVVVGLATLEIVLLAGTAFAVGARRKRRELALVAATGGDRRDVRRVVLAEGVVLGFVAGCLGVAGGIAAVFLGRPVLDRVSDSVMGPLDVRPLELAAVVAVGAGTALLATLMPARTAARQAVVAALTGRRGETRSRRRVPVVAVAAIAVGAALAFWAAGDGQTRFDDASGLTYVTGRQANFSLVLAGAVLAELGFVACAPALVGLVGRVASRLPLSLRLAARDAARHRTRSGPAVAAVVAAVAGSVALSVYVASDTERQRRQYQPTMPAGSVSIARQIDSEPVTDAEVDEAASRLPVRGRIEVYDVAQRCDSTSPCAYWTAEVPPAFRCPSSEPDDVTCASPSGPRPSQLAVADAAYVSWWTGRDDPGAARAMAEGKAVVFDERWLQDGTLVLHGLRHSSEGTKLGTMRVPVPAYVATPPSADYSMPPAVVLTKDTARRLGLPTMHTHTVLTTTRTPTGREEAAAIGVLVKNRPYIELSVERGFRPDSPLVLLALVAGAAFVTLAATGIATGLAAADSRPDLATLAAVGAAPRVRRVLAMAQAATVASLGSGLGILAGLVPSIAVVSARTEFPLMLPWRSLLLIAIGVPALAALLVGLVTRSRLPLERRIA